MVVFKDIRTHVKAFNRLPGKLRMFFSGYTDHPPPPPPPPPPLKQSSTLCRFMGKQNERTKTDKNSQRLAVSQVKTQKMIVQNCQLIKVEKTRRTGTCRTPVKRRRKPTRTWGLHIENAGTRHKNKADDKQEKT
ncbi:hypothetical protein RUM44_004789 [Polyplax serrata]|uniref:Uncharacterized protein n=1 Tax=Polyplax serrata TaxID=468196 RepID=A0ABR1B3T6_POLSC